jgi:hypothetical protein
MARSNYLTRLPLDEYAYYMGIPICHFNQLDGPKAPKRDNCDDIWDQKDRDDLAITMQQAEEFVEDGLEFRAAPTFEVDEYHIFGANNIRLDWFNAEFRLKYKHLIELGRETLTLKEADATISYLNLDNDPLDREETARIGDTLYADLEPCSAACDVAVFFRVADGAYDAADPAWEIRPIRKIDIDGTTMRLEFESCQLVKPELWDLTRGDCVGSDDPNRWKWNFELGNLVTAVDVYCRGITTANPICVYWDENCSTPCSPESQTACAYKLDKRLGILRPRTTSSTGAYSAPTYDVPPSHLKVSYKAGYSLDRNCQMNPLLKRAICKLTNAMLPEPPCGFCDLAETRWHEDRRPVVLASEVTELEAMNWPVDMYRGALEAARIVKRMTLSSGGYIN